MTVTILNSWCACGQLLATHTRRELAACHRANPTPATTAERAWRRRLRKAEAESGSS